MDRNRSREEILVLWDSHLLQGNVTRGVGHQEHISQPSIIVIEEVKYQFLEICSKVHLYQYMGSLINRYQRYRWDYPRKRSQTVISAGTDFALSEILIYI